MILNDEQLDIILAAEKTPYVVITPEALGNLRDTIADLKHQLAELSSRARETVMAERMMWQSRESEVYRQALLKRAFEAEKRADAAENDLQKRVDRAVLEESKVLCKVIKDLAMSELEPVEALQIAQGRLAANRAKVEEKK